MWKIVAVSSLSLAFMNAQVVGNLQPKPRHITGAVVDEEGRPVADARIEQSTFGQEYKTDSGGRFAVNTRAPFLVVRKAGFRSALLRLDDASEARLILQTLGEGRNLQTCVAGGAYIGTSSPDASFQFSKISGVEASRQVHDVDYGARSYYIGPKSKRSRITHGSGPMWTLGTPPVRDVLESVRYDERVYDVDGSTIIDARGQLASGLRWRYLGRVGESARYSDVDEGSAKILDKFLDGACLKPRQTR